MAEQVPKGIEVIQWKNGDKSLSKRSLVSRLLRDPDGNLVNIFSRPKR